MFTLNNTEGFSEQDLVLLNTSLEVVLKNNPDMEVYSASDIVTNNWRQEGGNTVETLSFCGSRTV